MRIGGCLAIVPLLFAGAANAQTSLYTETIGNVQNPLRGFYCKTAGGGLSANGSCTQDGSSIDLLSNDFARQLSLYNETYAFGHTLLYERITLSPGVPMTATELSAFQTNLANTRGTGTKVVFRVRYGGEDTTDCQGTAAGSIPSVEERSECMQAVFDHATQLGDALVGLEDTVAYIEMGFFGDAGEWSRSEILQLKPMDTYPCLTYGKAECDRTQEDIFNHMNDVFPSSIPLSWRRARYGRAMTDQSAARPSHSPDEGVTAGSAYDGSPRSRASWFDDGLVVNDSDGSTFFDPINNPNIWPLDWEYQSKQSDYTFASGESNNNVRPQEDIYSGCTNEVVMPNGDIHGGALGFLERFNFLAIENEWASGQVGIDEWRDQGCYDEIEERLGYRYVLTESTVPAVLMPGTSATITFHIRNEGFARFWWDRTIYVTLDSGTNRYDIPLNEKIQDWAPGTTHTISEQIEIPAGAASGDYALAIWIPDTNSISANSPKHSIRFASEGVWSSAQGYNVLATAGIAADSTTTTLESTTTLPVTTSWTTTSTLPVTTTSSTTTTTTLPVTTTSSTTTTTTLPVTTTSSTTTTTTLPVTTTSSTTTTTTLPVTTTSSTTTTTTLPVTTTSSTTTTTTLPSCVANGDGAPCTSSTPCCSGVGNCTSGKRAARVCAEPPAVCGNGIIESGEQCEAGVALSDTCVSLGFDSGTLTCGSGCEYDTSNCSGGSCGENGASCAADSECCSLDCRRGRCTRP